MKHVLQHVSKHPSAQVCDFIGQPAKSVPAPTGSEITARGRQQAHEAYLIEQQRMREPGRNAFIESNADEVARLHKVTALREHVTRQYTADADREQDDSLHAADGLIERFQEGTSDQPQGLIPLASASACEVSPTLKPSCQMLTVELAPDFV